MTKLVQVKTWEVEYVQTMEKDSWNMKAKSDTKLAHILKPKKNKLKPLKTTFQ